MGITILEIAKKTGYSKSTVHRALTSSSRIDEKKRREVLRIADKYKYEPNLQARCLCGAKTKILGILIPDVGNPFYSKALKGIDEIAEDKGYHVLMFTSHLSWKREERIVHKLQNYGVEGLLISSMEGGIELVRALKNTGIPYVGFHQTDISDISFVHSGAEIGAFKMTEYLISLGHRRIGHVTIDQPSDLGIYRKAEGYKRALVKNGIEFDEKLIISRSKHYGFNNGYEATRELLRLENPPTAIFALCDRIAVGTARAIKDSGLKIPEDISLAGYDNEPFSEVIDPPLTTVSSSAYEIGKAAAELLIGNIENSIDEKRQIVIDPVLVVRDSCRKIK
ncbi:MAG: HTH-type transcriptional regulator DegA [Lentisphaerae bacterium ADurb.Bin242]|nr:MAG: HTH-type transcriptional regulator DegA [Lentisphaerae bacterium ADurb.Bin242]